MVGIGYQIGHLPIQGIALLDYFFELGIGIIGLQ
jgi:hypothetical protein